MRIPYYFGALQLIFSQRMDEMHCELNRLRVTVPDSMDNDLTKMLEDVAQLWRQSAEAQSHV